MEGPPAPGLTGSTGRASHEQGRAARPGETGQARPGLRLHPPPQPLRFRSRRRRRSGLGRASAARRSGRRAPGACGTQAGPSAQSGRHARQRLRTHRCTATPAVGRPRAARRRGAVVGRAAQRAAAVRHRVHGRRRMNARGGRHVAWRGARRPGRHGGPALHGGARRWTTAISVDPGPPRAARGAPRIHREAATHGETSGWSDREGGSWSTCTAAPCRLANRMGRALGKGPAARPRRTAHAHSRSRSGRPRRSIDHGSADEHQIRCRGASAWRSRRPPTRRP